MSNTEKKSLSFGETQRPSEIVNINSRHDSIETSASCQDLLARDLYCTETDESSSIDWEDPYIFEGTNEIRHFPIESMPNIFGDAILEVTAYTKAPVELAVASALSAGSVATQGIIDVKRDSHLISPTSLFILTVADSGERKSTCDKFFTSPIITLDQLNYQRYIDKSIEHNARLDAWVIKYNSIQDKIRKNANADINKLTELENMLVSISKDKPKGFLRPKYLLGDETTENLTWTLSKNWPTVAIITSEGGMIFGSKSMSRESQLNTLGTYNRIWDGGQLDFGRKTSESYTMHNARLTLGIQTQHSAFNEFIKRTGSLARGTGFLPRCLLCAPKSTQGSRFYTSPPREWPALNVFHERITQLLNMSLNIDNNILKPLTVSLSDQAKRYWINYQNEIESEIGINGKYRHIKDFASKASENAARIAGIFHVFTSDISTEISLENFTFAAEVAKWYLDETNRFLKHVNLSKEEQDAWKTSIWLAKRCKLANVSSILRSEIMQKGPDSIRNKENLDNALDLLEGLNHIKQLKLNKKMHVFINPKILSAY